MKKQVQLLLTVILCLAVSNNLFSNEYRLLNQEEDLLKIIRAIGDRYNVYFTYNREVVEDVRVEQYNPEDFTSVDAELTKVLENTKLKYVMLEMKYVIIYRDDDEGMKSVKNMIGALQSIIDKKEKRQEAALMPMIGSKMGSLQPVLRRETFGIPVSGTVRDESGEPLIGATVLVKGTSVGTATDLDGSFALTNVEEHATLVISYTGYITLEVLLDGQKNMDITLQTNAQNLDEVVVTALGIKRAEKSLTYSAETINSDDLNQAKETNLINSLQGKVAGVTITRNATGPGSSSKVLLRGSRSIYGNNQPLYVIDGVPLDNTSREQGTGGTHGGRDGGDGIGMLNSDDIETMTVLKGAAAAALYGSQGQNGAIIITTKRGKAGKISVNYSGNFTIDQPNIIPEVQSEYGQGAGGVFNASSETSWGPKATGQEVTLWNGNKIPLVGQPNRIKDFFRTAMNLSNTLSIAGGSEKMQTYFSYGNTNAEGILANHDLSRHNLDLKISNNISSKLSFFSKLTYIDEQVENKPFTGERNDATGSIYHSPATIPLSEMQDYEYFDELGNRKQSYWKPGSIYLSNPYWKMNRQLFSEHKRRILGLVSAKYLLTDWLNFQVRGSIDRTDEDTEEKMYEDSYELSGNGNLYRLYAGNRRAMNIDALLSLEHEFSKDINLTANIGGSIQESKYGFVMTNANGLNKFDHFFMTNAKNPRTENSYGRTPQVQSLYATSTVAYKNYLFLELTARNDWSSALPKENQSYFYPAVGLTAVLTDMMTMPSWVSFGKARVTVAKAGYGGQEYLTRNYFSVGTGGTINTPSVRSLGNYKPELTTSFEAGLDWRFFLNRLGIDVTYYKSETRNQLISLAVPNATLFSSQYINAGLIQNSGVEIMFNATPIKSNNVSWDLSLDYSKNVNKVIKISDRLKVAVLGDDRQVLETVEEGKSYGMMYMAEWKKDDSGRRLVDANGVPIVTGKTAYAGNYNPNYMLGVNNSFNFKGLSFSFLIDYRNGGTVVAGTQAAMDASGNSKNSLYGRESGIVLDAYTENGEKNTKSISAEVYWQSLGNRTPVKDFYAFSGTNLRLREVVLGYRLPVENIQSLRFFQSASLSVVGRNLFFFMRKAPYDPEIASAVTNRGGLEYSSLPTTRNIGLNLKLSF